MENESEIKKNQSSASASSPHPILNAAYSSNSSSSQRGYLIDSPIGDGDCGYTAFGITRTEARRLLSDNLQIIRDLLSPAVRELLITESFFNYLRERKLISETIALSQITGTRLNDYAQDLQFLAAFIDYDVQGRRGENGDAGWAHPATLQALAHIQGIEIHMWCPGEGGILLPHRRENYYDYACYTPPSHQSRVDLLFTGNHFARISFEGYENEIPPEGEAIYPYKNYENKSLKKEAALSLDDIQLTVKDIKDTLSKKQLQDLAFHAVKNRHFCFLTVLFGENLPEDYLEILKKETKKLDELVIKEKLSMFICNLSGSLIKLFDKTRRLAVGEQARYFNSAYGNKKTAALSETLEVFRQLIEEGPCESEEEQGKKEVLFKQRCEQEIKMYEKELATLPRQENQRWDDIVYIRKNNETLKRYFQLKEETAKESIQEYMDERKRLVDKQERRVRGKYNQKNRNIEILWNTAKNEIPTNLNIQTLSQLQKMFLHANLDVLDCRDEKERTLLNCAFVAENSENKIDKEICELLLDEQEKLYEKKRYNPLTHNLLYIRDKEGNTCLHLLALHNDPVFFEAVMDHVADTAVFAKQLTITNAHSETPLDHFLETGSGPILLSLKKYIQLSIDAFVKNIESIETKRAAEEAAKRERAAEEEQSTSASSIDPTNHDELHLRVVRHLQDYEKNQLLPKEKRLKKEEKLKKEKLEKEKQSQLNRKQLIELQQVTPPEKTTSSPEGVCIVSREAIQELKNDHPSRVVIHRYAITMIWLAVFQAHILRDDRTLAETLQGVISICDRFRGIRRLENISKLFNVVASLLRAFGFGKSILFDPLQTLTDGFNKQIVDGYRGRRELLSVERTVQVALEKESQEREAQIQQMQGENKELRTQMQAQGTQLQGENKELRTRLDTQQEQINRLLQLLGQQSAAASSGSRPGPEFFTPPFAGTNQTSTQQPPSSQTASSSSSTASGAGHSQATGMGGRS